MLNYFWSWNFQLAKKFFFCVSIIIDHFLVANSSCRFEASANCYISNCFVDLVSKRYKATSVTNCSLRIDRKGHDESLQKSLPGVALQENYHCMHSRYFSVLVISQILQRFCEHYSVDEALNSTIKISLLYCLITKGNPCYCCYLRTPLGALSHRHLLRQTKEKYSHSHIQTLSIHKEKGSLLSAPTICLALLLSVLPASFPFHETRIGKHDH